MFRSSSYKLHQVLTIIDKSASFNFIRLTLVIHCSVMAMTTFMITYPDHVVNIASLLFRVRWLTHFDCDDGAAGASTAADGDGGGEEGISDEVMLVVL